MAQNTYKIDRMTLLFNCPLLDERFYLVDDIIDMYFKPHFDYLGPSPNFKHHYRSDTGLDIQIINKNLKRVKTDDKEILLVSGDGVIRFEQFEDIPQDYNLRLEYNPSGRRHPLWKSGKYLASFFQRNKESGKFDGSDIKVSRKDDAVDIYQKVILSSITNSSVKKWSVFGGPHGIETINLGVRKSTEQFTGYCKKTQLKEVKGVDTPHEEHYRFEFRNSKGFNLFDSNLANENLFRKLLILGQLPSYVPDEGKRGYQFYHELAQQYLFRIKNPHDFMTLNEALTSARRLDKKTNKIVFKYIKQTIESSQFHIPYEHPAVTFDRLCHERWEVELTKILQYLNLDNYDI